MTTTKMTKTISTLTVLATLAFGSAQAGATGRPLRGLVSVSSTAKMVVAGPIAIHAYSAFSGGTVFAARAVTGTNADCVLPLPGTNLTLEADRVAELQVPAGQVACLSTTTARPFELLWHVSKDAAPATMLARR